MVSKKDFKRAKKLGLIPKKVTWEDYKESGGK